ncbi:MAG: glutaredoxin 3 [Alphaproteobacteria bacterium]
MPRIEIYTTMTCPFCWAAKRLLKRKGAEFTEVSVSHRPALRREMTERAGGRHTVPQIFVDGAHLGDCEDLYVLDQAGKLDPLLEVA